MLLTAKQIEAISKLSAEADKGEVDVSFVNKRGGSLLKKVRYYPRGWSGYRTVMMDNEGNLT